MTLHPTARRVRECEELLEEAIAKRDKAILIEVKNRRTYRDIAEHFGVNFQRVGQIAEKGGATRKGTS